MLHLRIGSGLLLLGALAGAALLPACENDQRHLEHPGSADFELKLASGTEILTVDYTITGPGGYSQSGSIDVSKSSQAGVLVGGMPAGAGYTITGSATTSNGKESCSGSTTFTVVAGVTMPVSLPLTCATVNTNGNGKINATFNSCPEINSLLIAPTSMVVGGSVSVAGTARDPDDGPLPVALSWTSTSGAFEEPTSGKTSFKCTSAGTATLTMTASDGTVGGNGCPATFTSDVTCVPCGANGATCNDGNECTLNEACQSGACSGVSAAARTTCQQTRLCNGTGTCVDCVSASDCPGSDTACATRTCSTKGKCGVAFTAAGSRSPAQVPGDCHANECDGAGHIVSVVENQDVPVDGNSCTADLCDAGAPKNPTLAAETACETAKVCDGAGACVQCVRPANCAGQDSTCSVRTCAANICGLASTAEGALCSESNGQICNGVGSCVPTTFRVLRVGDGATTLTDASAPVFIERRRADGVLVGTSLAMPVATGGNNRPLTMMGLAFTEGSLTRSTDGRYLALTGYSAAPGTATIGGTTAASVPRVVGRIDASGTINTSTLLSVAFSQGMARAATTVDGSGFWVSGVGIAAGGANTSGMWYVPLGVLGGNQLLTTTVRWNGVFGGQLYGSGITAPITELFTAGSGLPTSGLQTATELPGMPTAAGPSPWGFVFFDQVAAVPGVDTLYVADDRSGTGRGIQKWTFNGTTWALAKTFNLTPAVGFRGLGGLVTGANITLMATTVETSGVVNHNRLVVFVDDGSANVNGTVLATSPNEVLYRGVAPDPH